MRFIQNQRGVGAQQRVALDLREQDAVGHELDPRVAPGVVVEAHLAAHFAAPRHAQFLRHPPRNAQRRHPPRLRAADPPAFRQPGSRHIFGSCVVLPEPVSPATTTT